MSSFLEKEVGDSISPVKLFNVLKLSDVTYVSVQVEYAQQLWESIDRLTLIYAGWIFMRLLRSSRTPRVYPWLNEPEAVQ